MREKGLLNIGANFEVGSQSPFDARIKVSTFTDLTDNLETTYPKKNVYRTMCVSVEDEGAIYMLITDPVTLYEASNRAQYWKKIGEFPEAPTDGKIYGRKEGSWTEVTTDLKVFRHTSESDKIDTDYDIRLVHLVDAGTGGDIPSGAEENFTLVINPDATLKTKVVNVIVRNDTSIDKTIVLPQTLAGWTIINGMTFTTISVGKSAEFNFLFIAEDNIVRILGEVIA